MRDMIIGSIYCTHDHMIRNIPPNWKYNMKEVHIYQHKRLNMRDTHEHAVVSVSAVTDLNAAIKLRNHSGYDQQTRPQCV